MSPTGEGSGYKAEAYRLEEGSTGGRDTKKRNGREPTHTANGKCTPAHTHTRDHHHHPRGPPPPPSAFSSKTKEAQLGGLTTNKTNIT